jgi:multiple sugar transport system substrate-binding protein
MPGILEPRRDGGTDASHRSPAGLTRRQFLARGAAATAAVTAPALLTACGGDSGSSSGPLEFWQFYAPGGEVSEQASWFTKMVKAWNRENETKIQLKYIPSAEYISGSKLQTAFSAGQGPDLFIISPGDFLRYYNGGVLQDLTPYISKDAQEDFYPSAMTTRTVEGKIYAIPMEVEPLAIYYSVQAFEEAGLSEGDIPTTWDQLLGVADTLKKGDRFGLLFETNPGYYQNFTWYPFMWQGGSGAVSKSGSSSDFDSEGAIQALQFWQDSITSGVAPRKPLGTGGGDPVANLAQGHCAMQNCGIWGVADLRSNAPDFDYGVFKLPLPSGGEYTTDLGGWAFVANSKGRNPDAAGKFCAWALASMSDDSITRGLDWISKAKSDLSPRKSVQRRAEAAGAFDSGAMKTFLNDAFPGGRGEPRYPPEVYRPISDAIQACQLNAADPVQEAQRAAQSIETFLQSYSGAAIV